LEALEINQPIRVIFAREAFNLAVFMLLCSSANGIGSLSSKAGSSRRRPAKEPYVLGMTIYQ
jgi:hypothetical protein